MIVFIILTLLTAILFLLLVRQFSNSYKTQRIRLENSVAAEIVSRIENIRTYGQEQNGWKNNFPSVHGWERTTLHVSKDFILVTGESNFPFLFKSELQPFIISLEPEPLINRLAYERIFRPSNMRRTNYGTDLELTIKPSGFLGSIKVHLIFENLGKHQLEKLFEITNWHSALQKTQ